MSQSIVTLPVEAREIVEAEYILLGGLIYDNRRIDAVADILSPEDFNEPFFGHMFGLVVSEYSQGRAANPITLRPLLIAHPDYQEMGGSDMLAGMAVSESLAIAPLDTAKMIARRAKRRRLMKGLSESIDLGTDENATFEEIIDAADYAIVSASQGAASAIELTGAACVHGLLKSYAEPKQGVKSGVIPSMDNLLGPIRAKQLVILAARPGMGKTAAALSYALGAARGGHGVMFVSLEMGGQELAARMAGDLSFNGRTGVPLDDILADDPTPATKRAVAEAMADLDDLPLSIVDTGKLTVGRLNMMVRRTQRHMAAKGEKLELVVVDYLQLLSTDDRSRSNYEAVSEISRGLKAMAKDNGVGILALAQLSREVEKRTDKRPQLSDLRDSGQIEQDADAVVFLIRDEYYLRQNEPDKFSPERAKWEAALDLCENKLDFICAKRRNGRTGSAQGNFYTRFQAVRG
jgi:replicative DNA helicase